MSVDGVLVPISNKVLKARIVFNADETGWRTIWDMQTTLDACVSSMGLKAEIYMDSTTTLTPDIVISFVKRNDPVEPPKPANSPAKQLDNLMVKDKKEEK